MPILGGSPLGLIGVLSGPTRDGMSTFNGGRSRNVNVNLYNAGREGDKQKLGEYEKGNKLKGQKGGAFSIFTGGNFIKPWANIKYSDKNKGIPALDDEGYSGVSRRTLHNNDIYDTSILNIIEKTSGTTVRLRPTDFAYLKDLGVYPNNRLVIARRFSGPQTDDIYRAGSSPQAVLITWRKPEEEFLDISFGEEWEEAKGDFTELLNKISEDITGKKLGGVGAIPLPGWTEALQNEILQAVGVKSSPGKFLAAGEPNLIKQAKRRKTVPYGEAGSGLKATVQVKMTCEYEQKFISGIDPTIVFMDIISNALRFGTSPSQDYGLSDTFAQQLASWVADPSLMVKELGKKLTDALNAAKNAVKKLLEDEIKNTPSGDPEEETKPEPSEKEKLEKTKKKVLSVISGIIGKITGALEATISKYKEEVKGIARALSGNPSTVHHVTIGNPLRPMFCAGDMWTDDVKLTLGPNLAFNDLPATIKIDFTLQNARPLGLQEIKAKFNTGNLRTVNVIADSSSLNDGQTLPQGGYKYQGTAEDNTTGGSPSTTPTTPAGGQNTTSNNTNTGASPSSPTKDGNNQAKVNTNPNSPGPVVENDPTKKTVDPTGGSSVTGGSPSVTGTIGEKQKAETAAKTDPVADANATSKKGYTYRLLDVDENLTLIKVTDKNGVEVLNKKYTPDSFPNFKTVDDSQLIADAKTAVGDV